MATLVDFLVALVTSAIELARIFLFEVAVQDPLSFVSWVVGAALTTGAVLFFGYLVLGALVEAIGFSGRSPPQRPAQRGE